MRCFRLVLSCLFWLSLVRPAFAHTVLLLRPPNRSSATAELLERLRGELLSIGFEVVVRARPEPGTTSAPEPMRSKLAAEARCDAALDVVDDSTPGAVDVWIVDSDQHFELLARVKVDANSENYSKALAIRTSEVLRARLVESHASKELQSSTSARPVPPKQTVTVESRGVQHSGRLGLELGAAALTSLDGLGLALLPLLRADWAVESKLVLQATLAGFGTRPSVAALAGEAKVAMQYALVGACYRLEWQHRVRPLAAFSVGALHTAVDGQAEPPWQGHLVDQWSFLLDASLGATFQLSQRYAIVLAGHVQLAEPYVAIHLGEQSVASSGRPNLLVSLALGVWP